MQSQPFQQTPSAIASFPTKANPRPAATFPTPQFAPLPYRLSLSHTIANNQRDIANNHKARPPKKADRALSISNYFYEPDSLVVLAYASLPASIAAETL